MKLVKLESVSSDIDYGLTESATDNNTGHKFLRITDIRRDNINWDEVPFCECNEEDSKKYELHDGDIVFARTGSVGNTGLIINSPKGAVFASYLIRIRPNQKILDPKYLSYYFQTTHYWNQIDAGAVGAIQGGLNATKLKELTIPLPPLPEQQRIASLLTRADRLRRLRRYARELSGSLLQSVFLEMFGDPKTNPKGWEKTKIRDVTTIIVPTRDKPKKFSGDIPWITLPDLDGLFISNAKYLLTKEDAAEVGTRLIPSNTVLLSCAGSLGKVAITTRSVYSNQQFYGLIAKPNVLDYFFLAMQLKIFGEEFYFNMAGMSTLGFFSKDKALDIEIILPPLTLQEQFASVVARYESLRRRQAESARQAEGLFQSMLSETFLG